jgi:hypothetical protein
MKTKKNDKLKEAIACIDKLFEIISTEPELFQSLGMPENDLRGIIDAVKTHQPKHSSFLKAELIQWQGTGGELIYLFDQLFKKDLITKHVWEDRFAFIRDHFLNNKNEPFKNKQLSVTNKLMNDGKPANAEKIEEIVNGLKKKP